MARFAGRIVVSAVTLAVAAGGGVARAQTQPQIPGQGGDPTDTRIFMPYPDGDPSNPQRFRKPKFGNPPGSGAGSTGFDSTNLKGARKMRRPPPPPPPLPPLAPQDQTVAPIYRDTAVVRRVPAPPVPLPPPSRTRVLAPGTVAVVPVTTVPVYQNSVQQRPQVRRGPVEEDPFGPVGIRAGAFIWKPAVELTGGYDSNVSRVPNGQASPLFTVAPELQVKSDWTRHDFQLDMRGSYIWYTALEEFNKPTLDVKAKTRIDINRETRSDLEGRFALGADNPGNPNNPTDVAKPPTFITYGGTAGLTRQFNRFELTVKGTADRTQYDNAELNDGSTLNLTDSNYNQFGWAIRGAYEMTPGLKPFVEVSGDRRIHDNLASTGIDRDSDGRIIKGGMQFEMTRKLTGEIAVGKLRRDYVDPALPSLDATLLDGSLVYYATPLTTLKFEAKTSVAESDIAGVSGTLTRDYVFSVDHSFRRWLIGTLKAGYGTDNYEGLFRDDKRYFASAAMTYKLTRTMALKGEFRQDWLRSNVSGVDYTASTVMVGLRLQQ